MKIYIIKLNESRIDNFFIFCATFHIRNVANWVKESGGFFPTAIFYFAISDMPSGGITTEEKSRLITDFFLNDIFKTYDQTWT